MFNFMKWRWLYALLSLSVIIPGLISLGLFGLRPALDFTGGSLLVISLPQNNVTATQVSESVTEVIADARVTQVGFHDFQIKTASFDTDVKNQVIAELQAVYSPVLEQRFESLGPAIGQELLLKTAIAITLSLFIILSYLTWQFRQLKYGVSAVAAMIHDTLVIIGSFSVLGHFLQAEVDSLFVTALLTALSFSVHDTIVVYDRIRELRYLHPKEEVASIVNGAIWQTLTRSLNNSMTVISMLLALVVLGGESIRYFAVALLIGAITGTYSSTFVAVPLIYTWEAVAQRFSRRAR